jgi:integrase/recombinase XerD
MVTAMGGGDASELRSSAHDVDEHRVAGKDSDGGVSASLAPPSEASIALVSQRSSLKASYAKFSSPPVGTMVAESMPYATRTPTEPRDAWEQSARVAAAFLLGYQGSATEAAYACDLRDFYRYATAVYTAPLAFTRTQIELYVRHLMTGRQLAPATVSRRLAALSGLFGFAAAEEAITRNPMLAVRRPRIPNESQTLGLERDDLLHLLAAAERHSPRANALLSILAMNGLRISEVLMADADHLSHRRGVETLRIRRKGSKVISVPLTESVASAVRTYLGDRKEGPLIMSRTGRRLDRGSAGRLLRQVAAEVLSENQVAQLHPHTFRHAWITACLDSGVPIHELQRAASHASPAQTMRYAASKSEISRSHPTFRLQAWLEAG